MKWTARKVMGKTGEFTKNLDHGIEFVNDFTWHINRFISDIFMFWYSDQPLVFTCYSSVDLIQPFYRCQLNIQRTACCFEQSASKQGQRTFLYIAMRELVYNGHL